eukprot:scaffold1872_cov268-Chaetoceros_neogracile.AAC.5
MGMRRSLHCCSSIITKYPSAWSKTAKNLELCPVHPGVTPGGTGSSRRDDSEIPGYPGIS